MILSVDCKKLITPSFQEVCPIALPLFFFLLLLLLLFFLIFTFPRPAVWLAVVRPWQGRVWLGGEWQGRLIHIWCRCGLQVPQQAWPRPNMSGTPGNFFLFFFFTLFSRKLHKYNLHQVNYLLFALVIEENN